MAAYPALEILIESERAPIEGLVADLADDGTPRARSLFTAPVFDFTLVHALPSWSDVDSILDHYADNYTTTFSYTWPDGSVAHTCHYLGYPQVQTRGGFWEVRVRLRGRPT